jgi:hypothetical protein
VTEISTGLTYLATPYTLTPDIDRAFQQAARVAAHLSLAGITVFSPIVHSHPLVRAAGLDHRNPAVYAALNARMMDHCNVLVVVLMEGWHLSDGIKEEVAFFERTHKPIYDCYPVSLLMVRRPMKSQAA